MTAPGHAVIAQPDEKVIGDARIRIVRIFSIFPNDAHVLAVQVADEHVGGVGTRAILRIAEQAFAVRR